MVDDSRIERCGAIHRPSSRRATARSRRGARLRGADADPARRDSAAPRRDAICSARRRPAPARPPRSSCRCSTACSMREGRTRAQRRRRTAADRRPRAGADARAGDAGRRSDPQVRQAATGICVVRRVRRRGDVAADPRARARRRHRRGDAGACARSHPAGTLELDAVRLLVLDEADEMLDMGFAEDIDAILQATPESRQTALFSATMPPRHARDCRAASAAIRSASRSRSEKTTAREAAARPPDRLRRRTRAQAGGAAARARHGEPGVRARLLPHARSRSSRSSRR